MGKQARPPGGAAVRMDHLVLAVPELEAGAEEIRSRWRCPVLPGGRHPRWGSWNALVPMTGDAYLEIIAPHPDPPERGARVFGLDGIESPTLVTWAVRPGVGSGDAGGTAGPGDDDGAGPPSPLEPLALRLREVVDPGPLLPGSRRTPSGVLLEWTLSDPFAPRLGGVIPFLIDWGRTPHPSGAGEGPPRVTLRTLTLVHPEPEGVGAALAALGAGSLVAAVEPGEAPGLRAVLETPAGVVELG